MNPRLSTTLVVLAILATAATARAEYGDLDLGVPPPSIRIVNPIRIPADSEPGKWVNVKPSIRSIVQWLRARVAQLDSAPRRARTPR